MLELSRLLNAAERDQPQYYPFLLCLARDGLRLGTRIPIERRHFEAARGWLTRFTLPLRTLDALHLALADLQGLRVATADEDLARSAKTLRIQVTLYRG